MSLPSSDATATVSDSVPILVLDTNVCLDLFVFNDPRWTKILNGLQQGRLRAITRSSCRAEWLAVLHYTHLPITDATRPGFIADFDQTIELVDPPTRAGPPLPRCSDTDDQQFLEIARDGRADYLITKDKALLKCAKKTGNRELFVILSPALFIKNIMF